MHLLLTQRIAALSLFVAATTLNAQWNPLESGLVGSRTMANLDGDLYVATYPSGVRKSTDDGASWNLVNNGLPQTGNSFFVRSVGASGNFLFAGTHSGIFRSGDDGASWSSVNGTLTATDQVFANKFFRFNDVTFAVFAGSISAGGGIARSSNNGNDWFIGHSGMGANVVVYQLLQDGATLYAATSTGLYTSSDVGLQWTAVSGTNFSVFALARMGGRLVASTPFGMRWSDNNGSTWTDATGGVGNPSVAEMALLDGAIYVHGTVQGSGTGCFRSMDNGATWSAFNTGFTATDQGGLQQYHIAGNKLYVCALLDVYSITGTGTGVAEREALAASIFPSPFVDGFTLQLPDAAQGSTLVITDATGREVLRRQGMAAGANAIARQGWPAGLYHCLIEMPGGTVRQHIGNIMAR
jgi:hypothetical protein